MKIVGYGPSMSKILPTIINRSLSESFEVIRPKTMEIDFSNLKTFKELLIMRSLTDTTILYRCQIEHVDAENNLLLIGTPWFNSMDQVMEHHLTLKDFAVSDSMMDLLHVLKTEEIASYEVQELLEKINKQKKDSERIASRLNSLFEYATEGIILTDHTGTIILVNPSACQMFDYTPEELTGKKVEILIPEQLKKSHEVTRKGFYDNPHNRVMGKGRDLKARKKSGNTFPVEVSLSTYLQNNERFVIAFIIDITERKTSEENMIRQQMELEKVSNEIRKLNSELEAKVEERTIILREALQRLEKSQEELSAALDKEKQLNEIKGRFVAMASHEFRTPLSTVLSSATLLSKYVTADDQPKRERHIEKIKDSVHHLDSLLNDFLSLGKLDEGKIASNKEEFDLADVINDTIYEMNGSVKPGQKIIFEQKGPALIASDKRLLKNILINLLSNAIKFSDEGKSIFLLSENRKTELEIAIRDEGMGISEEDQQHLFSTFFRGKNAFNIQGTGLGLHIVKRYLSLLNGSIQLKSELGKGTTITFIIPKTL